MAAKKFHGKVVSTKMDKTIVVAVETAKSHPLYGKRYVSTKKFKVHDETNSANEGDRVSFVECAPISKFKKFKLLEIKEAK